MPNMDGLEATRLIREAGYKGPIVALSAYSDEANVKVNSIPFFALVNAY
jgi:osomolarity two-component system sensor histidine kinase SLN1